MADEYQTIRAAIASKGASDLARIRRSTATRTRIRGPLPALKVYLPTFQMGTRPNAYIEEYTLTYPGELLVGKPANTDKAELEVITIARDLQVAWWSDTKLGLPNLVQDSWITSMQPAVDEYDRLVGYAVEWLVKVHETLPAPGRTA